MPGGSGSSDALTGSCDSRRRSTCPALVTTVIGGTSLAITAPAPTTEPRPIVTPGQIVAAAPIQTSSPITIGAWVMPSYRSAGSTG